MSKHIIIGTAGHVDHGKTSLIKALTGFDCDTHKEEKERGITINLGFTHVEFTSGDSVGIVDVPGHKDFIKTMISGASGIDMVLLVIAADSGIMPQTHEHLRIIEMLGISYGVVALTKSDLVDEEMLELARLEIMEFLEETNLSEVPIVEVSSVAGKGIDELKEEIQKCINKTPAKKSEGLFRMYIDRVFNIVGKGLVVTGSVLNGQLSSGAELYLLPGRERRVKVKTIQRHGEEVGSIQAGDRAAINLSGIKVDDFERGMILSDNKIEQTSMLDVVIELFDEKTSLGLWSDVLFHSGTFFAKAKVHLLNSDELKTDMQGIAQLHLEKPAILLDRDKFIIRNTSNDLTLGGGTIIDASPLHHKRRTPKLVSYLETLADAKLNKVNLSNLIVAELDRKKVTISLKELSLLLGIDSQLIEEKVASNSEGILKYKIDGELFLLSKNVKANIELSICNSLEEYHSRNRLNAEGMSFQLLKGKLFMKTNSESKILSEILDDLHACQKIKPVGSTWALFEHKPSIDSKTLNDLKWLENVFLNQTDELPVLPQIEKEANRKKINSQQLKALVKHLVDTNVLLPIQGSFVHAKIISKARQKLIFCLKDKAQGINEKEAREILGVTKRFLQILLSIFVNEGVIERRTFYILLKE